MPGCDSSAAVMAVKKPAGPPPTTMTRGAQQTAWGRTRRGRRGGWNGGAGTNDGLARVLDGRTMGVAGRAQRGRIAGRRVRSVCAGIAWRERYTWQGQFLLIQGHDEPIIFRFGPRRPPTPGSRAFDLDIAKSWSNVRIRWFRCLPSARCVVRGLNRRSRCHFILSEARCLVYLRTEIQFPWRLVQLTRP